MQSFSNLPLHTDRLVLRLLGPDDATSLFAIFSNSEVMRYWSTPAWTSIEQALAFLERDAMGFASGQHLRLGIERQDDQSLIGQCTLFGIFPSCRRAEIGYGLARNAWGNGYANEALRALINYGFATLNLNRIEADIDPRNENSAKALLRLGFAREGYMRERWIVGDEVSDTEFYGLLKRDWRFAGASDAKPLAQPDPLRHAAKGPPFHSGPLATCRNGPVSSNVRPHTKRRTMPTPIEEQLLELKSFATAVMSADTGDLGSSNLMPCTELSDAETRSPKTSLKGWRMAVNDCIEMTSHWSTAHVKAIDANLHRSGIVTLSEIRRRYSSRFAAILKRGRIRGEVEYYLAAGLVADLATNLTPEERTHLQSLVSEFERKSAA